MSEKEKAHQGKRTVEPSQQEAPLPLASHVGYELCVGNQQEWTEEPGQSEQTPGADAV